MSFAISSLESFLAQLIVDRVNRNLSPNADANADASPPRRNQVEMAANGFPEDNNVAADDGDEDRGYVQSPQPGEQPLHVEIDNGSDSGNENSENEVLETHSAPDLQNPDVIVMLDDDEEDVNLNRKWHYGLFDCWRIKRNCKGTFSNILKVQYNTV